MKSKTASTIAIILVLAVVVMVAPPALGQLVTAGNTVSLTCYPRNWVKACPQASAAARTG